VAVLGTLFASLVKLETHVGLQQSRAAWKILLFLNKIRKRVRVGNIEHRLKAVVLSFLLLRLVGKAAVRFPVYIYLPARHCCRFGRTCSAEEAAQFFARVAEQTFATLPEKGGAVADVGQLLLVAAVARAVPLGLARVCPQLSHLRSKLLSPGRIQSTLWLLGQVRHGECV
jgi:hypothetical protein